MVNSYPLSQVATELNSIISQFLTEYSEELQKKADRVTEIVASDFAEQLKTVTPRSNNDTVHMADTVVVSTKKEKAYGQIAKARYVSYKKWQTAHLLEFGWTARNGNRIDRQPFVRPLFDRNKDLYYRMYKEALSSD